jgi:uncharacterized protein
MPEYLHPGVYIEEILGPQPIQGVSTSTTGMVGVTEKGPTEGRPVLVTSFGDFRAQFGGFLDPPADAGERLRWELDDQEGGYWWRFPFAVKGFFDNGGRRLYVKRVVSSQATAASVIVPMSAIAARPPGVTNDPLRLEAPQAPTPPATGPAELLRVNANAPGRWGRDISVRVRPDRARRIQAINNQGTGPLATTLASELDAQANSAVLNWPTRLGTVTAPLVVEIAGERFTVTANPTLTGGQLTVALGRSPAARRSSGTGVKLYRRVDTQLAGPAGQRTVPLARTDPEAVYIGALVLVGPEEARATVAAVTAAPVNQPASGPRLPGTVTLTPVVPASFPSVFESDVVAVIEATVDVRYKPGQGDPASRRDEPEITESFPGLRLDPPAGTPVSIVDLVNEESRLVTLEALDVPAGQTVGWGVFPGGLSSDREGYQPLADGGDDALDSLSAQDFVGEDDGNGHRTGIQSLEDIEDIAICAVPGMWARSVQVALIGHCERLHDRFAVLDAQRGLGIQDVLAFRSPLDSFYAALYHPWLVVRDPATDDLIRVPPSGHVAGLYAFVDNERGVHKAPANVVIQEIDRLDDDINEREQDLLNPVGVNALREFPNRGRRIWGARTLSSVPEWRYVNVRRLFIFIEDSIKQGTQWVVFEPNAEPLWALVTQTVTNFLDTVWRTGALEGTRQEEAFFVRCDRTTMTEDDVANGRLIMEIGIAPVRPAEFVIFRFRQKTRSQVAVA